MFIVAFNFLANVGNRAEGQINWKSTKEVSKLLDSISGALYTDTIQLSLEQAVEQAIRQNRSLQNASIEVRRAQAQRWQTIARMLPQAQFDATYTNEFNYTIESFNAKVPNNVTHTLSASLTLNGQMVISALLQNTALEMQKINQEVSEKTIRENVNNLYMTMLNIENMLKLQKKLLANVQKLYKQTVKMVEVGTLEKAQADLVKINVNRLKTLIKTNERQLNLTENSLKILLVEDEETKVELTDKLDDFFAPEKLLGLILDSFVMQRNTTYRLGEQNLKLAKQNWHMAGWAFGPTASLSYRHTWYKTLGGTGFNMQPDNILAVTVSFPLLSSGERIAGVIDKKLAYEEQENSLSDIKDNLNVQYKQLRYNLVNSYETYKIEKGNIDAVNSVLKDVTNKQKWGVASTRELITAMDDLIEVQQSYLSAMLTLIQNRTALEIFLNNK